MVHIMIVSHGPLAEALKESCFMFFGEDAENLTAIGLYAEDSPDKLKAQIVEKLNETDDGDGVLIFVDIFAGTPCNMTAVSIDELKGDHNIQCFTGVNLPILMEALSNCEYMSLEELYQDICDSFPDTFKDLRKTVNI